MRHIHPVRQSGPIPPYDGPWSMEDVKRVSQHMNLPWDFYPQHSDIEEMMRRVPGLTRKEALKIQTFGFKPEEEIDFAYLAVNNGIDVFYVRN